MLVFHQWPYILVRLPCYTIRPWSLGRWSRVYTIYFFIHDTCGD